MLSIQSVDNSRERHAHNKAPFSGNVYYQIKLYNKSTVQIRSISYSLETVTFWEAIYITAMSKHVTGAVEPFRKEWDFVTVLSICTELSWGHYRAIFSRNS